MGKSCRKTGRIRGSWHRGHGGSRAGAFLAKQQLQLPSRLLHRRLDDTSGPPHPLVPCLATPLQNGAGDLPTERVAKPGGIWGSPLSATQRNRRPEIKAVGVDTWRWEDWE